VALELKPILSGDVFVITALEALLPTRIEEPAEYDPAKRKTLTHPSTQQDVADFVTEYLYSDVRF
jgi:RNA-dependent RNA polymerase